MFNITFDRYWEFKVMEKEHLSKEALSDKEKNFENFVLDIMRELANNNFSRVTFYPYRTARVFDEMFDADRNSMRPLEYMLAIKAGVNPDNHTVYEVHYGSITFYIFCSDNLFRIGETINKKSW